MAYAIQIPRLGWSMEQGTFVGWLKHAGDLIRPGDPLFELEGEKALQEIEAVDGGILRIPPDGPQPGAVLAVGATVGYLVSEGEANPWESSGEPPTRPTAEQPPQPPAPTGLPPAAPPSVRRLARELGVSLHDLPTSSTAGRITVRDLQMATQPAIPAISKSATTGPGAKISQFASPRARKLARELGLDWTQVRGSGATGRVRESDVRTAAASQQRAMPTGTLSPVSARRRVIAQRMLQSQQQTAPVTLTTRIDATHLVSLRQQFKATGSVVPSFTDLIAKLVALVIRQHPVMAARWTDAGVEQPDLSSVSIGIAVDTDEGLLVPVLHDVAQRSLMELANESKRLIDQARNGKLSANEMQGGQFTLTNLGAYGIDAFTPIINLPEAAILGLGAIRREAVVLEGGQIVPREQMTLSLTFDHRIVDGAPAARFLQALSAALTNPSAWLLS